MRAAWVAGLFFFCLFGTAHAQLVFQSKPGFYYTFDQMPLRGGSNHIGYGGMAGYRFSKQHAVELSFSRDAYKFNENEYSSNKTELAYTWLKPLKDSKWNLQAKVTATHYTDSVPRENSGNTKDDLYVDRRYSLALVRTFDLSRKVKGMAGVGVYVALCNTPNSHKNGLNPRCPSAAGFEIPFGVSFPLFKRHASLTSSIMTYNATTGRYNTDYLLPNRGLFLGKTKFTINL